jgi:CheY-like chemotaxis protein
MLFAKGHEVMEAENGEEFLKLMRAPKDLMLLDINMPGIKGIEVCIEVRSQCAGELQGLDR